MIDIRLKPQGGGFARKKDLPYFLSAIGNIVYQYVPECAPTPELFNGIKSDMITFTQFRKEYLKLIKVRDMPALFSKKNLSNACFLCYEADPDYCHRKILAEYLDDVFEIGEVIHL